MNTIYTYFIMIIHYDILPMGNWSMLMITVKSLI